MAPHSTAQTDTPRWSRTGQFCAANGIDPPAPMTPAELADLERRQDAADEQVEKIFGLGQASAA